MSKYLSRKFILAVAGGIVMIINAILEANDLPAMPRDTVLAFVGLLASYILGEAYADANRK